MSGTAAVSEQKLLDAYRNQMLREPRIAAETLVRALAVAAEADRPALVLAIARQLVMAASRLAAVYMSLSDRRFGLARTLAASAPGAEAWLEVAGEAGTLAPEEMVRVLGLGEDALDAAREFRGQPGLAWIGELQSALERGSVTLEDAPRRGGSRVLALRFTVGEQPHELRLTASEDEAATLADLTSEFSAIATGFLDSYLRGRRFPVPDGA